MPLPLASPRSSCRSPLKAVALLLGMLMVFISACDNKAPTPAPDTGADTTALDTGLSDTAAPDTAPPDTAPSDTTSPDTSSPTDTGPPPGSGVEGGWSITHDSEVIGARFIHPINTDKDGAIVASRVASALGGLGIAATSDARRATLDPTRMSDADYVEEIAAFIVDDLYGVVARSGAPEQALLTNDTLVLSSVHRYGLYVAETLHARMLPLQLISFADSWEQVVAASTSSTVIVGQDYDYDGLWLWNKLAAGAPGTAAASLPPAYLAALSQATELVVVQPDDNWAYCTESYCWDVINEVYTGGDAPIYLHTSLTRSASANAGTALYAAAAEAGHISDAPDSAVADLKQWEWGVPDAAVSNLRAIWADLGKPAENLTVIRGGVVEMYAWTPALWRAYLEKNEAPARGLHFSSYWVANTQLERCGAVLPIPSYSYWQESWHPLDDNARALLTDLCGGSCPASYAENTRAFVNTIGSSGDPAGTQAVMTDFGLTPEAGAWYGLGINAEGAAGWTGWSGEPTATAWEITAEAIQDAASCPYAGADWEPLTTSEVCDLGLYRCE